MHFDDRLATVLRLPEAADGLARIQFQQLVDLLAAVPPDASGRTIDAGFARLSALAARIPDSERARMLRRAPRPLRSSRLIAQLAEEGPEVACAAIAAARIGESEWLDLIPALPIRARGILRHRRDLPPAVEGLLERLGVHDRALPAGPMDEQPAPEMTAPLEAYLLAPEKPTPSVQTVPDEPALPVSMGTSVPERSAPSCAPATSAASVTPPLAEPDGHSPSAAQTGNLVVDQDMSNDVAELLDLSSNPPPPTSLSEWARARAAQQYEQAMRAQALRATPENGLPHTGKAPSGPAQRDRAQQDPAGASAATGTAGTVDAGIGAIVRRIEEFRKARRAPARPDSGGHDAPRLPLDDIAPSPPRLASVIDFATDAEARINWADGPHASSVAGFSLVHDGTCAAAAEKSSIASYVRRRLPLRGQTMMIPGAPALAGPWTVDAVPRFDPASARFIGYAGRLRRPFVADGTETDSGGEGERLREVLHELRTPANAIQVAAEIIQQQLYGPAPHEYRALAAAIAGDCAHILAGFEELDRLAKLETGALSLEEGTSDLAPILVQTMERLRAWTEPRRSGFILPEGTTAGSHMPVALDRGEAERLLWRLFAALVGTMAPDERLHVKRHDTPGRLGIDIPLPRLLEQRPPEALFETPAIDRSQSLSAGMFGTGFTLRLATAEAAAAGGSLRREGPILRLLLPALTTAETDLSTFSNISL